MNDSLRFLAKPVWLALIIGSVLAASGAALWVGLQQDTEQTATTYVFGRRVGYLDRPIPTLDDHLDDIVNAVEFPTVIEAIFERTLLTEDDFTFTIERVEDTESVVAVAVHAARAGDAERVARILAEEVVRFVLEGQDVSVATQIGSLESAIKTLEDEQDRLRGLSFGVPPVLARNRIEAELLDLGAIGPTGTLQGELQVQLANVQPLADSYQRNAFELNLLYEERARSKVERADVEASIDSVNDEWYRSITPVESASNVPVAIAMAFAAAVPAALVAVALSAANLNLRITGHLLPRRRRDPLLV